MFFSYCLTFERNVAGSSLTTVSGATLSAPSLTLSAINALDTAKGILDAGAAYCSALARHSRRLVECAGLYYRVAHLCGHPFADYHGCEYHQQNNRDLGPGYGVDRRTELQSNSTSTDEAQNG